MWFPVVLLASSLLNNAWAATTSSKTIATPTTTYCPRFYSTLIVPSPTAHACGDAGRLSKPDLLAAYCGYDVPALGSRDSQLDYECYRACASMPQCQSFSIDPAFQVCYIYGKTLQNQGFTRDGSRYQFFWDMRSCFKCTSPRPPVEPGCPSNQSPKSPPTAGSTCNALGTIPDTAKAIYHEEISGDDGAGYNPDLCYQICAEYYEPVGVCKSFLLYSYLYYPQICYIFNSSLAGIGFRRNSTGMWKGWDLQGCFNRNLPSKTAPACQPTHTPVGVGVRNGNFQRTYVKDNDTLQAYEWTLDDHASIQTSQGNVFATLDAYIANNKSGVMSSYGAQVYQVEYGLDYDADKPDLLYNYSFDVAIPYSFVRGSKVDYAGCFLQPPGSEDGLQILSTDKRYQGSTFKHVGPYLVNRSNAGNYLGFAPFSLQCNQVDEPSYVARAIFWIDNFRITRNGKDIGDP